MKNRVCIRQKADVQQIMSCKVQVDTKEASFEKLSNVLCLAGNKVRLKILFLLSRERALCVCDLSDILAMNTSAISQHLRKLKDRDIIRPSRDAQTIYYSLNPEFHRVVLPLLQLVEGNKILECMG